MSVCKSLYQATGTCQGPRSGNGACQNSVPAAPAQGAMLYVSLKWASRRQSRQAWACLYELNTALQLGQLASMTLPGTYCQHAGASMAGCWQIHESRVQQHLQVDDRPEKPEAQHAASHGGGAGRAQQAKHAEPLLGTPNAHG